MRHSLFHFVILLVSIAFASLCFQEEFEQIKILNHERYSLSFSLKKILISILIMILILLFFSFAECEEKDLDRDQDRGQDLATSFISFFTSLVFLNKLMLPCRHLVYNEELAMLKGLLFILVMAFASCAWCANYFQSIQDQWLEETIFQGKREGVLVDIKTPDGFEENKPNFFEKERGWTAISIDPQKDFAGSSLTEILKQKEISRIDYLSIDAEGAETKILEGIDLDAFPVDVIATEINFQDQDLLHFLRTKKVFEFQKNWLQRDLDFRKFIRPDDKKGPRFNQTLSRHSKVK